MTFNDIHRGNLSFTQFTKNYENRSLLASDIFNMFTQLLTSVYSTVTYKTHRFFIKGVDKPPDETDEKRSFQ